LGTRQAGLPGGFALLSAALLIIGNLSTHDVIEKRLDEDLQTSLQRVIPSPLYTNNLLDAARVVTDAQGQQLQVYRGIKAHQVTAVTFRIIANGYATGQQRQDTWCACALTRRDSGARRQDR
jgi:electron transport complex protein RnfG